MLPDGRPRARVISCRGRARDELVLQRGLSLSSGDPILARATPPHCPSSAPEPEPDPRSFAHPQYVFAFLERFTHLVDYDATNPVLPNVMTLEQALIDSSPPASAFAQAAAAAAASNPTRTSARLLEETTKQRVMPLTAVAIRNSAAAAAANANANGGNGAAGAEAAAATTTNGDKPQPRRSGSPASSLSSLTASESGGDNNTGTTTTRQDEAAYLAAIQAVETASVPSPPIDPVPPPLPIETESPPHSDLLKTIIETFIENLRPIKELSEYHGKKTWFHFLINFVSYRFNADPLYRGGFRWETNLLRTRGLKPGQEKEDKWWKLRWQDKVSGADCVSAPGSCEYPTAAV